VRRMNMNIRTTKEINILLTFFQNHHILDFVLDAEVISNTLSISSILGLSNVIPIKFMMWLRVEKM